MFDPNLARHVDALLEGLTTPNPTHVDGVLFPARPIVHKLDAEERRARRVKNRTLGKNKQRRRLQHGGQPGKRN